MRTLLYALTPLALLFVLASFACVLGYIVLFLLGDVIELRKVISKGTQVLLVLSIFPLRKWLKLSWPELGFAPAGRFIRQMGWGLLLAVATLLPVLLLLYGLDVHVVDADKHWTAGKIVQKTTLALVLALLISFVEEPLFRGILLAGYRRRMAVGAAVALSSFYYAALHFLKSKTDVPYQELTFASGFRLLGEAFANWVNPEILSALLALWVVGVFLALIRTQYENSLGLCVGCHAGWVWQIKVSKDFFDTDRNADFIFLVSDYDGVVGPLVTVWLSLAIAAYFFWKKKRVAES